MGPVVPRWRALALGVVIAAGVSLAASPAAVAAPDPVCVAVAHHQDASHTGAGCGLPTGPLATRWSTQLLGTVSYPLVAAGKVFVVSSNTSDSALLYALNARTGTTAWGPVPLSRYAEGLTYADGRVFVNDFNGDLTAFAAATGRQLWTAQTQYFAGEPVAFGDSVFLQSNTSVSAFDATRGTRQWVTQVANGDSALAVDDTGVYVSGYCSRYRLDRGTGAVTWRYDDGCSGGVSGTAYVSDGRFFDSSRNRVMDTTTGRLVGSFAGAPAFARGTGYFVSGTTLFASTVARSRPVFSVTLPTNAVTGPVVADGVVWIGLQGNRIVSYDALTGAVGRTVSLTRTITQDLAIGQGRMVVVAGDTVLGVG